MADKDADGEERILSVEETLNSEGEPATLQWPWQREAEKIATKMKRREVVWIHAPTGSPGRTLLGRYMENEYWSHSTGSKKAPWLYVPVTTVEKARDYVLLHMIRGWQRIPWTGKGIVLDVYRCAENTRALYALISELKDAYISSREPCLKVENYHLMKDRIPVKVLVLATFEPTPSMLTKDRVRLLRLCSDEGEDHSKDWLERVDVAAG